MDQKGQQEEQRVDFYVVPLVGGAIAGFIIADWIGASGILGTLIGAFVVDAWRGLRGTHLFVKEVEHLVQQGYMATGARGRQPPGPQDADGLRAEGK